MAKRYGLYMDGRDGVEIRPVDGDLETAKGAALEMARDLAGTYEQEGYELSSRSDMDGGVVHMEWVRSGRTCKVCGKRMWAGYVIDGVCEYYCSDACLLQEMTQEEYDELFEADEAGWTECEEDFADDYEEVLIEPVELVDYGDFYGVSPIG